MHMYMIIIMHVYIIHSFMHAFIEEGLNLNTRAIWEMALLGCHLSRNCAGMVIKSSRSIMLHIPNSTAIVGMAIYDHSTSWGVRWHCWIS